MHANLPPAPAATRAPSLRGRLHLLVLSSTLPLVLLFCGTAIMQHRLGRAQAGAAALDLARALTLGVERELATAVATLEVLALSPGLHTGGLTAFRGELMRYAGTQPHGTGVMLLDASGASLIDSRIDPASPGPLPHRDPAVVAETVQAALQAGRPVVSGLFPAADGSGLQVAVDLPVSGPGQAAYVLSLAVRPAGLDALIRTLRLPDGVTVALFDRNGAILATTAASPDGAGRLTGRVAPARILGRIQAQTAGILTHPNLAGEVEQTAFNRSTALGWTVAISTPQRLLMAPLWRNLALMLLAAAATLGVSLLLARALLLRVLPPMRALAAQASGTAAQAGTRGGAGSLGMLEADIVADALRAAARDRTAARDEMQALFDAAPLGVLRGSLDGQVHAANAAYLDLAGATQADVDAGRVRWDDLAVPDQGTAELAQHGRCAPYEAECRLPDGRRIPALVTVAILNREAGTAAAFVLDLSARREAEAALRDGAARLRLAMEGGQLGTTDRNLRTGQRTWSPQVTAIYGRPPAGPPPTDAEWLAAIHPDDRAWVVPRLEQAHADAQPCQLEYRIVRLSGEVRWITLAVSPLRDGRSTDGPPAHMFGIVQDITARHAAAAALAASEARMRQVVDALPVMAWVLTRDGTWLHSNQAWAAYAGGAAHHTLAQTLELFHPDDRTRVAAATGVAQAAGTGYDLQARLRRHDGVHRWHRIQMTALPSPNDGGADGFGAAAHYVATAQDINRMQADAARIADAEIRLRLVQDCTGTGTWDWNIITGAVRWSEQQDSLFGRDPAAGPVMASTWQSALHPDDRDRVLAELKAAVTSDAAFNSHHRIVRPDGEVRWHRAIGEVRRDSSGTPVRMTGVNADITNRHAVDAALAGLTADLDRRVADGIAAAAAEWSARAAAVAGIDRHQALARLAAGAAGRMCGALSGITAALPLLVAHAGNPALVRDLAAAAAASAAWGEAVARPLLAFAGAAPLRPGPVAIAPLLARLRARLQPLLPGIRIVVEMRDLPPVQADAGALDVALDALAENARDAMPGGGTLLIQVTGGSMRPGVAAPQADPAPYPDRFIRLSFTDTGTGMDAATLARAGEPFFSTRPSRLGLGLATARGLAAQLGGKLVVESPAPPSAASLAAQPGTVVTLWLPQAALRSAALAVPPQAGPVLLAADSPGAPLDAAVLALSKDGWPVVAAPDAVSALTLLRAGMPAHLLLAWTADGTLMPAARALRPDVRLAVVTDAAQVPAEALPLPATTSPDEVAKAVRPFAAAGLGCGPAPS